MKFNDRVRFMDEEFERLWARVSDINHWLDEQRKRQDDERKRWWEETLRRHEQQRGSTGRHIVLNRG